MRQIQKGRSEQTATLRLAVARQRTADRASGRVGDDGVSLIEVLVAFVVLMVALVPLSYLFTTSLISAGQSKYQQEALSIAEKWVETLSNVTPPVNSYNEVNVGKQLPPAGPGAGSTTVSTGSGFTVNSGLTTPTSVAVAATTSLAVATSAVPQSVTIATSAGPDIVTYTGQTYNGSQQIVSLTGMSGWSSVETVVAGAAITQPTVVTPIETKGNTVFTLNSEYEWTSAQGSANGAQPNLCLAGTPQLLRLKMTVSWGPTTDSNNVQDSVVLNYPPAGIQTLGFIALQVSGDSTAQDTQQNPWSERVQAPKVVLTNGVQTLNIYPDSNGCAFAQVPPGTWTVSIGNATSGILAGNSSNTTYGSPSFVQNAAGSTAGNVLTMPQSVSQSATVQVGAVSRLSASYDQGSVVGFTNSSASATEDGVACPVAGASTGSIACISSGETGTGSGVNGTAVLSVLTQGASTWTGVPVPSGVTRLQSVACAGAIRCLAAGFGSSGGVILSSPAASTNFTADTLPTVSGQQVTSISQVVCPSPSQCVAIGSTALGGAVLTDTVSSGGDNWAADPITATPTTATVSGLANLACPVGSGGCIATALTTSPSAGTPAVVAGGLGLGWTASSPNPAGVTVISLSALACPTTLVSTTCVLTGRTATGPAVVSGTAPLGLGVGAPAWTWKADALPASPAVSSLKNLICPLSTECLLTGSTATSTPVVLYGATTPSTSVTFAPDSLPATLTAISQIACPTTSTCVLTGTTATGPAIVTGTISGTAGQDSWPALDSLPTLNTGYSISQLSMLTCWTSPSCAITAVGSNPNGQPTAFLLTSTGSLTGWSSAIPSLVNQPLYLNDIDCVQTGTAVCSAVGAGATGAVQLVSTGGPAGSWSDQTAIGLSGLTTTGIPVALQNTNLLPSQIQTLVSAGWSVPPAQPLPPVYPFNNGYSVFAGDCIAESQIGSGFGVTHVATVPGGSASTTVPLGVVSILALHATTNSVGLPYAGATFSLTSTTASPCLVDSYPLQTAGADGLSRTEVPFGTYTLTVHTSASTTTVTNVVVGGSSVTTAGISLPVTTPIVESVS